MSLLGWSILLVPVVISGAAFHIDLKADGKAVTGTEVLFTNNVQVALSTTVESAGIFYTLDGSPPSSEGTQYFQPFSVDRTFTIRAVAVGTASGATAELQPIRFEKAAVFLVFVIPNTQRATISGVPSGWIPFGTVFSLTANPQAGVTFLGWDGDVIDTDRTIDVTVTKDTFLYPIFGGPLLVSKTGPGIVEKPAKAAFPFGKQVRVTAVPNADGSFAGWRDPAGNHTVYGNQNPLSVTPSDEAQPLTATFEPLPTGMATVTLKYTGSGRASTEWVGQYYPVGTEVEIETYPHIGEAFLGWSGDVTGNSPVLKFILDRSKVITGVFSARTEIFIARSNPDDARDLVVSGFRLDEAGAVDYSVEASSDFKTWTEVGLIPFGGFSTKIPIRNDSGNSIFRLKQMP